jgi:hypothetical protein
VDNFESVNANIEQPILAIVKYGTSQMQDCGFGSEFVLNTDSLGVKAPDLATGPVSWSRKKKKKILFWTIFKLLN